MDDLVSVTTQLYVYRQAYMELHISLITVLDSAKALSQVFRHHHAVFSISFYIFALCSLCFWSSSGVVSFFILGCFLRLALLIFTHSLLGSCDRAMYFLTFFLLAGLVPSGFAAYSLQDDYSADKFINMFSFDTVRPFVCLNFILKSDVDCRRTIQHTATSTTLTRIPLRAMACSARTMEW